MSTFNSFISSENSFFIFLFPSFAVSSASALASSLAAISSRFRSYIYSYLAYIFAWFTHEKDVNLSFMDLLLPANITTKEIREIRNFRNNILNVCFQNDLLQSKIKRPLKRLKTIYIRMQSKVKFALHLFSFK
jgi:hypothetical protein